MKNHSNGVTAFVDWLKDKKEATLEQIKQAGFSKEVFVYAFNKGLIFEPNPNRFKVV